MSKDNSHKLFGPFRFHPLKHLKLQGKFFLYFTGLVVLVVIFISVAIFYFQRQLLLKQAQEKALSLTQSLAYTSLNAILDNDYLVLQNLIDSMMDWPGIVSIAILDNTGKVLAASQPELRGSMQDDLLTRRALAADQMIVQQEKKAGGQEMWSTAVPITRLNQSMGIARMRYSLEDPLAGLVESILVIGLLAISLSLLLAYRFSQYISKPIRETVHLAAEYGKGNLDASLHMDRRDELGELVESLNKLSQELKTLIDEKIANENLVMMGEFASYIIHDLKNPLSGIHLLSDGLHRKIPDENPLKKYATEILLASQKLHDFVERTLDISRWNRLNLQKVDMREVIDGVLREIERGIITIETEVDPGVPLVNADYQLLQRALKNMLTNAVEAIEGAGTISIRVGWNENHLIISIQDTGCGIPRKNLNTIFRPFFSMKKQGHGLGLAMVRKVVVLHRGKIQVESQEGSGSTFTIMLPGDLKEQPTE